MNLDNVYAELQPDMDSVASWCDTLYQEQAAAYFKEVRILHTRLESKIQPITDDELTWVLVDLPIQLFKAAEVVNRLRLEFEVIKLKCKNKKTTLAKASTASTATARNDVVAVQMLGDDILLVAYNAVICRIESEMSWSKELIMGAKKIWDSRRRSEQSNPISEVVPTYLPNYGQSTSSPGGFKPSTFIAKSE